MWYTRCSLLYVHIRFITYLSIQKGIDTISKLTSFLTPIMGGLYILIGIIIILLVYMFVSNLYGRYNPQNIYNMNPTEEHYQIADWAISGNKLGEVRRVFMVF